MSRCHQCQAQLTAQDRERGFCSECGASIQHVSDSRDTLVTPPPAGGEQTLITDSFSSLPAEDTRRTESMPIPKAPRPGDDHTHFGDSIVGHREQDPRQTEVFTGGEGKTSAAKAAEKNAGRASVPVLPVTVHDVFKDTNTRQSINPENFPHDQRTILTSLLGGGEGRMDDASIDVSDTSLSESIMGPMDRSYDSTNVPRTMERSVFEHTGDLDLDEHSLSSWQARSGLGAESNLVIQQRSVFNSPNEPPKGAPRTDYQLVDLIGKGGMGTVWKARQYSVGRTVAIKMIRVEKAHDKEARERFLSEAVITGDLDHPNIIPIHDLGRFESDELFYSMRRVTGQPWDKVMFEGDPDVNLRKNLEIWNKVCDAIAFAHDREVIHRDIKPENVMVGEFGEVLVMDWGLAMPLPEFQKYNIIMPPTRSGGSPAYMAPEMVGLLLDRVGKHSDIYLLGATLYEIVTGNPPHPGRTVSECVTNARNNVIQPFVQGGKKAELLKIALKAMATDPDDRYSSVVEMQAALKRWEEHQASLEDTEEAILAMQKGKERGEYAQFNRSVFGFEKALERWQGNQEAKKGLHEVKLAYAQAALARSDFDLGLSLLDSTDPQHAPMVQRLSAGKAERESRQARIKGQRIMMAGLAALILIGSVASAVYINGQKVQLANSLLAETKAKNDAKAAEKKAVDAAALEKKAREDAEVEKQKALAAAEKERQATLAETKAKDEAKMAQTKAEMAQKEAVDAKEKAVIAQRKAEEAAASEKKAREEETIAKNKAVDEQKKALAAAEAEKRAKFDSDVRLAASYIEQNSFAAARQILDRLNGKDYESVRQGMTEKKQDLDTLMSYLARGHAAVNGDTALQAVAVAPGGKLLATGSRDGRIQLWKLDAEETPQPLGDPLVFKTSGQPASFAPIKSLTFSADGKWLACSGESVAIRLYDVEGRKEGPTLIHPDEARRDQFLAVEFAPQGTNLLSASGNVLYLWDALTGKLLDRASGHADGSTVRDLAWAKNGTILSAGSDKQVSIWKLNGQKLVRDGQFGGSHAEVDAVALSPDGTLGASAGEDGMVHLWTVAAAIASRTASAAHLSHHEAAISSLAFSADGKLLVSSSEDNTSCVWDTASKALKTTLRGHGNVVTDCAFAAKLPTPGSSEKAERGRLVTVSSDSTIRVWNLDRYVEPDDKVLQRIKQEVTRADTKAHEGDVLAIAVDATGKSMVTAARDRTAVLWDTASGDRLRTFKEGHSYLADKVFVIDGGKRLLSAAQDQTICLWDVARGVELQRLEGNGIADAIAVSSDNHWLLTGSDDRSLQLWDLTKLADLPKGEARPEKVFPIKGFAKAAAFAPDKFQAVVSTDNNQVLVCDFEAGQVIAALSPVFEEGDDVNGVAFLSDGRVVSIVSDGNAVVSDVATRKTVAFLTHNHSLTGLALSGNSRFLATIGRSDRANSPDPQITVWDLTTALTQKNAQPLRKLAPLSEHGVVTSVSLGTAGEFLTATTQQVEGGTQSVLRFNLAGMDVQTLPLTGVDRGLAMACASLPDGSGVVTIGEDEARLWTWGEAAPKQSFRPHRVLTAADLTPDAATLITGDMEGTVKVWDVATGRCLAKVRAADVNYAITSIMFSPTKPADLVISSDDTKATLWTWNAAERTLVKAGELTDAMNPHKGAVTRARYSGDGETIVTGSEDGVVRVWNAATKKLVAFHNNGNTPVVSVDVLTDGSLVVFADDSKAQVFSVKDAATDHDKVLLAQSISGHGREMTDVRFAGSNSVPGQPQQLRVLTSSLDGTGKIWEVTVGTSSETVDLLTLGRRGRTPAVTALGATRDGSAIITGHQDGHRFVWRTP